MNLLPISHRQQRQQSDCLVACAAMLLAYLQIPFNYPHLLKLLATKPFGTVFGNLRELRSLGLHVLIEEGSLETLARHIDSGLPCITAIKTGPPAWDHVTNHAVLVVGIDDQMIYLHDPEQASGPQTMSYEEFAVYWVEQDYFYAVIGLDAL